ncbi:hypothetical protein Malapachy_2679 [Malassezia pachydermatis]|uniref:VPS37 C-terminal domain-containing protein n=1 Tax=Malassezia pachydermatis TaxID=77020 RepID=A0A0M8MRH7_9BASI|nr:hypothetical protein Malapachy_2679 [Malassezia pachydermatis]KOS15327.1 hypothetical protein Malapachy_2679 [Malassezia pachydermatis]
MDPTGAAQRLAEEYPSIAALPREMLEELASSPETMEQSQTQAQLLEALVDQLPAIQTLNAEHEALVEQVEAAAARNNALRPELEALRRDTQDAFTKAKQYEHQWPEVERALLEARKRFTPEAMQVRLHMAVQQLHDETEKLVNDFIDGLPPATSPTSTPMDDTHFVRHYCDLRTRYHLRAMQYEQYTRQRVQWKA